MTSFPQVLDNTIINAFRSCPQQAFLAYVRHWKSRSPNIHLHAGAAFAHGLEAARRAYFDKGQPPAEAYAAGLGALLSAYGEEQFDEDSAKTPEGMARAFEYYFSEWPLGSDPARPLKLPSGRHAIEFSFAEPLEVLHPETGEPIIYSGRADMICQFNDGIFVEDDKTTKSLGQSWADQWELRSQFTGYVWAARRNGIPVDGVLVRGVAILKTKIDRAQHITYRPQWEVDRWYEQTIRDVQRMIDCWTSGYWDYNLGESCNLYGGCQFRKVCKVPDPDSWLPVFFEQRIWDPLTRKEITLDVTNLPS